MVNQIDIRMLSLAMSIFEYMNYGMMLALFQDVPLIIELFAICAYRNHFFCSITLYTNIYIYEKHLYGLFFDFCFGGSLLRWAQLFYMEI